MECEGLMGTFDTGASGISVGAGGFVEKLIFGCVQASQRSSISLTDTRMGDIRVLVETTWEEDSADLLPGQTVQGLRRLEGRGPYFDSLWNSPYDEEPMVRFAVTATTTTRMCYYLGCL